MGIGLKTRLTPNAIKAPNKDPAMLEKPAVNTVNSSESVRSFRNG